MSPPTGRCGVTVAARDLLFCHGSVFDGRRFLPPGTCVRVSGGRITAVGPAGAGRAGVRGRPAGRDPRSRVHRRPRPPAVRRDQLRRCDLREATTAAGYVELVAAYARDHPDEEWITGGGWSLDAFPGGLPRPPGAGRRRERPPGVPAQPRRARQLGQQPGARAGRDRPLDPGSAGRPHRARCRRRPHRHAAGGCRPAGLPPAAPGHRERLGPGPAGRPVPAAVPRHHRLAGRHRRP